MITRTLAASLAIVVGMFGTSHADPTQTSWFRGAGITVYFSGEVPGGQVLIYAVADEYLARANVEPKEYFLAGAFMYGFFNETATGKQYYFDKSSNDVVFKRAGPHHQASLALPVRWCVQAYPDPPSDCFDDTLSIDMDVIVLDKLGYRENVTARREFPEGLKVWENREQQYMPVIAGETRAASAVLGGIPVERASASLGTGKIVLHY